MENRMIFVRKFWYFLIFAKCDTNRNKIDVSLQNLHGLKHCHCINLPVERMTN